MDAIVFRANDTLRESSLSHSFSRLNHESAAASLFFMTGSQFVRTIFTARLFLSSLPPHSSGHSMVVFRS